MSAYLTQPLHKSARYTPNKIATVYGDKQCTFKELLERVERFAGALQSLGLTKGDRVSIIALNSDHYIEMLMGILWAGGVVNPLNTRWTLSEFEYAINDAQSSILIVDKHFSSMVKELVSVCDSIQHTVCDADERVVAGCSEASSPISCYSQLIECSDPIADAGCSGDDLAMLLYTGGTTGFPKGVMLSHTNLFMGASGPGVNGCGTSGGVFLHVAPMFHMADIQMMLSHFVAGGTHVVLSQFVPDEVLACIRDHQISDVLLVPTMIHALVNSPKIGDYDLAKLKNVFYGGAPISQATLNQALVSLPKCSFIQGYGMTETCLTAMLPAFYHTAEGQKCGVLASAGTATAFAEIKVVDPQGAVVPNGTVGELVVKGPTVMQGYWNKPEQSSKTLKNGWMHTEDAAYLNDEGFIFIVDRLKDMIISGGENIYSSEVENALATHPCVYQCAVIGIADDVWGEAVHAVVVLNEDAKGTELTDSLIAHCKSKIASYKAPRSIAFVETLPLSAAGKLLKTELRKAYSK